MVDDFTGQKAPSATRRIKTRATRTRACTSDSSQKAPSAKRCIKTRATRTRACTSDSSQKAPSAKRCIKTRNWRRARMVGSFVSESTEPQKVH